MEKNDNFKSELETQYNILIKASEKKATRQYIAIMVVLSITLISVLVSIIFSFKALSNSKRISDEKDSREVTYYQTLSTVFNGSPQLNLSGIGNGYELSVPKTIEVTNDGNTDILFNIKLSSINTSLLSTNNLVYTLSRTNGTTSTKELPLKDKVIASEIKIAPKETISFIIKVQFKGTIEANNYSNYYNSKIVIEQIDNRLDLLE